MPDQAEALRRKVEIARALSRSEPIDPFAGPIAPTAVSAAVAEPRFPRSPFRSFRKPRKPRNMKLK